MLIKPKSKVFEKDLEAIFPISEIMNTESNTQIRKGRYVVNVHLLINEALLLDDDNNVIDGFCGYPMPQLPWRNKPFVSYLAEINGLDLNKILDKPIEIDYNIDEEFDKRYWK